MRRRPYDARGIHRPVIRVLYQRRDAADLIGKPLPFKLRRITGYLTEALDAGKLRLRKADIGKTAFPDACRLMRKGGVIDAPRKLMKAMGIVPEETVKHAGFNFCCGGDGVVDIQRAAPLR